LSWSTSPALAALLVLGAFASTASAGDVLQLKDGKLVAGKVVTLDDAGVTFSPDTGGSMRVGWDLVVPMSRFELWQASLASDDAAGRVALAKWARSADLFLYARREFVKAKGLGYAGPEKLDDLIADVDKEEAEAAITDIDAFTAAGGLEKALERAKSYLKTAPPGPQADAVHARASDLVKRIEIRDAAEKDADESKKKAEKEGKLKDWVERNREDAKKRRDAAALKAADGFVKLAKGNQTLTRDAFSAAETWFQDARVIYRRVKKAVGAGDVADQCDKDMQDCDRRTVEVLAKWGRMEVDNKAWKRASPIVDRGLKIDPVNRELLDLRATIDANWIRRRLSDVTNAHGHESN
jgi:hypothetical protein